MTMPILPAAEPKDVATRAIESAHWPSPNRATARTLTAMAATISVMNGLILTTMISPSTMAMPMPRMISGQTTPGWGVDGAVADTLAASPAAVAAGGDGSPPVANGQQ